MPARLSGKCINFRIDIEAAVGFQAGADISVQTAHIQRMISRAQGEGNAGLFFCSTLWFDRGGAESPEPAASNCFHLIFQDSKCIF